MQRRQFLTASGISIASLALLRNNSFATLLQDPFKITPLRNNVGIFTEKGGTIAWLVNKEGIVVVDAEFPEQATHLITELKKRSDKPFEWLINTHHHGDHTSGNISFKGIVNKVAAHSNSLINQTNVAVANHKEDQQLYPDTTWTDTWQTNVGDEHIKAYYFGRGHTNGDSMIHFEHANIVHTGDLVFNRSYPVIDMKAGASLRSWAQCLQKAQKQFDKDTLFVFGHAFDPEMVTGNMDDIKAMQNYMERAVEFVGSQIKAGKTKDDIAAATAIPGVTDWQGQGIKNTLNAAYDELTAG